MFKSSKRKRLFTVGAERGNKGPDVMSDGIFSSLFRDQRLTSSKERNINGEIIYIYISRNSKCPNVMGKLAPK